MRGQNHRWLTAQETAADLNTTSSEICRLISVGRLSGTKQKDFRRTGKAQWLIDPKSIARELRRNAQRRRPAGRKQARRLGQMM
jgi:hypothetical protein